MPTLNAVIDDIVRGDDRTERVTIDRDGAGDSELTLPNGATITDAWLTVKRRVADDDDDAVFQKHITTSNVAGVGQIENDGTGDVDPIVRFDLVPADTRLLPASEPREENYDIQVKTSGGKIHTAEKGKMYGEKDITQSTS